jgi:hypothetical protein
VLLMAIQTAIAFYFFIEPFTDAESYRQRVEFVLGSKSDSDVAATVIAVRVFIALSFVLELLSLAMLLHLQGLHIYLLVRKMTTWKWILETRAEKKAQAQEREELGMGPDTPTCHALAVSRHKEMLRRAAGRDSNDNMVRPPAPGETGISPAKKKYEATREVSPDDEGSVEHSGGSSTGGNYVPRNDADGVDSDEGANDGGVQEPAKSTQASVAAVEVDISPNSVDRSDEADFSDDETPGREVTDK